MSAVPSWARVGAKVVCVIDGDCSVIHPGPTVYTIDGVECCPSLHIWVGGYLELAFRFRPLVTQQDDIATYFEQFLHTPQKIEERA